VAVHRDVGLHARLGVDLELAGVDRRPETRVELPRVGPLAVAFRVVDVLDGEVAAEPGLGDLAGGVVGGGGRGAMGGAAGQPFPSPSLYSAAGEQAAGRPSETTTWRDDVQLLRDVLPARGSECAREVGKKRTGLDASA